MLVQNRQYQVVDELNDGTSRSIAQRREFNLSKLLVNFRKRIVFDVRYDDAPFHRVVSAGIRIVENQPERVLAGLCEDRIAEPQFTLRREFRLDDVMHHLWRYQSLSSSIRY